MNARLSGTYLRLYKPREPIVGSVVVAVVVGLAVIGYLLLERPFAAPADVSAEVLFGSAQGLTAGDPVMVSGVRVGRVDDVVLEERGRVRVRITVVERAAPHRDATASIGSINLVGDRFVALWPGTAGEPLGDGAVIAGSPGGAALLLAELRDHAERVVVAGMAFSDSAVRQSLDRAVDALERTLETVNGLPVGRVRRTAEQGRSAVRSARARLDTLPAHPALDSLRASLDSLGPRAARLAEAAAELSATLARLQETLASDEGTLGRLRQDSAGFGAVFEAWRRFRTEGIGGRGGR